MLRRAFRDSVIYALGRGLTAVVGIVLLPFYTAHLSASEFGVYDMGTLVITLATLVVALEIAQGAARYYCEEQDDAQRRRYFSTALWFTAAAFALLFVAITVLAPAITPAILGPEADPSTLLLVGGAAGAVALYRLGIAQLRWLLRPWSFIACNLLQLAITAGVAIALILLADMSVDGLFIGQIVGNLLGFAVTLALGRRGLGLVWSPADLRRMLKFSTPLVTSSTAVFVATFVDRVAIKEIMSMADLGRYAVAYRFALALQLVLAGFELALTPLIYAHYKDPETSAELARLLRRLLLLGSAVLFGLAAFSTELLHVFVAPEFRDAANLIPLLGASVFVSRLYILAPGLWIEKRTGTIALINVTVAVLNLGLNIALIPALGVHGAAIATLTSASTGFAINIAAGQRFYPIRYDWGRLLPATAVAVLGVTGLIVSSPHYEAFSPGGLALKTSILVGGLGLAASVLVTRAEWSWLGARLRRR